MFMIQKNIFQIKLDNNFHIYFKLNKLKVKPKAK